MNTANKHQLMMVASALLTISLNQSALADNQPKTNQYWWPKQIDLTPLRMNNPANNPLGSDYNYRKAFNSLDLKAIEQDLTKLMTSSQPWWPADFGNYGPFFIRMAWHSAGTYRITDGRGGAGGGTQRFASLNSWPDNANLDKARRLLWPIKQKYGNKISWADLMVLAGNVALESMGFKTIGFAGGRHDAWQPQYVNWGTEGQWLGGKRYHGGNKLEKPYAATQMGLIYVNPEGPKGVPDPKKAAAAIRVTFSRMGMNDEETVALIAGGHAFGKAHGAANPHKYLGPAPEAASIQQQGFGWKNSYKTGYGPNTITSGLEGAWTVTPTHWNHNYLQNLFSFDWEKTKSPGGAIQWQPKNKGTDQMIPDAFNPKKRHAPIMFTTDLALRFDPTYKKIAKRFHDHPAELNKAFAKAWFKLMTRDMGPRSRYLGSQAPKEIFIWQDPVPAVNFTLINDNDAKQLKQRILNSKLTIPQLVRTAWASASTFRGTDKRGGANGARIQLNPQINWPVNDPQDLKKALKSLTEIQNQFNQSQTGNKKVSLADIIVLGGDAAIEKASKLAGNPVTVPFKPGRTDALQSQTDVQSFAVLEPKADGFRNYYDKSNTHSPTDMLIEKAAMLNLTVPEMTALIGGMRVLNANEGQTPYGVFTNKPGQLNNSFFINLLDMSTKWKKSATPGIYTGVDRASGKTKWQGTAVDLIFGANSELRAVAEVYGTPSNNKKFVNDFVKAWVKVMQLDRFDVQKA